MIFWERQKSLTAFYEACTKPVRDAYDLTQMQFNILMFLHNNPQFDTAGDLVKTRHLTKSHVSTALKELEARGWIEAHYAAGNRKSQHLRITKSAEAVIAARTKIVDGAVSMVKMAKSGAGGVRQAAF